MILNIFVIALAAILINGAPQNNAATNAANNEIPVIRFDNEINPDGSYAYSYETGNGIKAQESGAIQNPGSDNEAMRAEGSFEYTDPEGGAVRLTYIADENGFQPQGDHLPTPPPIPEAIQRALDYLATVPTPSPALIQQKQIKKRSLQH